MTRWLGCLPALRCQRNSFSAALVSRSLIESPFMWSVTAPTHRLISLSFLTAPPLLRHQVLPHQWLALKKFHVPESFYYSTHWTTRKNYLPACTEYKVHLQISGSLTHLDDRSAHIAAALSRDATRRPLSLFVLIWDVPLKTSTLQYFC